MEAKDLVGPAAAVTIAASAMTAPASAAYNSELNQPSYWGSTCSKTDMSGEVMTYSVTDPNAVKVVVKGGTENKVYEQAPFTNLTAPINPNNGKPYAISHVIVCYKDGTSTTTTPSTTPATNNGNGQGNGGHVGGQTTGTTPAAAPSTAVPAVAGTKTVTGPAAIANTGNEVATTAAKTAGLGALVYGLTRFFRR